MNDKVISITDKQRAALSYIVSKIERDGYPPTRAEMALTFGWASGNAAQEVLNALERKGLIKVEKGIARGIKVLPIGHWMSNYHYS